MGLPYGLRSHIHEVSEDKKEVTLCRLGGQGVGAMQSKWDDRYLEYPVCTGCMQGETDFKKEGLLKEFIKVKRNGKHNIK